MATKTEEAIAEQEAALADMALAHEGLTDLASVDDIKSETKQALHRMIGQYDRRKARLENAVTANRLLMDDGFPALEIDPVGLTVHTDLTDNQASINAALARIKPAPVATNFNLVLGPPQPK